jgi:hypothetical protein
MTKLHTKALITLVTVGTLSSGIAFAQTSTTSVNLQGSQASEVRKSFMQTLTDAQKTAMEKAKSLFAAGKPGEAKTVLDQAGVKQLAKAKGKMKGHGKNGGANREAVNTAIIAGDYTAFKTAASSTPMANISQDVFNSLRAPMQARKEADEQVRTILTNAGIQLPVNGQAQNR